jgi:hypothetical protein
MHELLEQLIRSGLWYRRLRLSGANLKNDKKEEELTPPVNAMSMSKNFQRFASVCRRRLGRKA